VRVNLDSSPEISAEAIERLLASSPGENPVVFEFSRTGDFLARLRPRKARTVKPDGALISRLRELCGDEPVLLGRQVPDSRE
jgi:hypothetical protein